MYFPDEWRLRSIWSMAKTMRTDQAVKCEGPGCHEVVRQQPGGHRRRRFCCDDCKQRAYRVRLKERREGEEITVRCSLANNHYLESTQQVLMELLDRHDYALA